MKVKALAFAAAMAGFGVTAADSATVTFGSQGGSTNMTVLNSVTGPGGNTGTVAFDWNGTPTTGFVEFTALNVFDLVLKSYNIGSATPAAQQATGYVLKVKDALTGLWTNLTTDTANCAAASGVVAGNCNMIGSTGYTGGIPAISPVNVLGSFAAGTYLLGVYDSSVPVRATATFSLAAVPLPATGLALIAGLGGLAALGARSRRRNAA